MIESIRLKKLKNKGFLIEEAMHYCAGSETIYMNVLQSALEESEEKLPLLQECPNADSLERYRIEVHGLKNVAQTIGAAHLYHIAEEQNGAAKSGDLRSVSDGHGQFLAAYRDALQIISEVLEE